MKESYLQHFSISIWSQPKIVIVVFALFVLWSLYWKGRSLWASARAGEKEWFILLLLVNSLGLLDIYYLYIRAKTENQSK